MRLLHFSPPGTITTFHPLEFEGVRLDAGYEGWNSRDAYYDPLVAKLVMSGEDRADAIARGREAAKSFAFEEIESNLPLYARILASEAFERGEIDTGFIGRLA